MSDLRVISEAIHNAVATIVAQREAKRAREAAAAQQAAAEAAANRRAQEARDWQLSFYKMQQADITQQDIDAANRANAAYTSLYGAGAPGTPATYGGRGIDVTTTLEGAPFEATLSGGGTPQTISPDYPRYLEGTAGTPATETYKLLSPEAQSIVRSLVAMGGDPRAQAEGWQIAEPLLTREIPDTTAIWNMVLTAGSTIDPDTGLRYTPEETGPIMAEIGKLSGPIPEQLRGEILPMFANQEPPRDEYANRMRELALTVTEQQVQQGEQNLAIGARNLASSDWNWTQDIGSGKPGFVNERTQEVMPVGPGLLSDMGRSGVSSSIYKAAGIVGIDPLVLGAIWGNEGHLTTNVAGGSGEISAFQFMPGTWRSMEQAVGRQLDPNNFDDAALAAAWYVSNAYNQLLPYAASPRDAAGLTFLAYNAGGQGVLDKVKRSAPSTVKYEDIANQYRPGINTHGVRYDAHAYADRALAQYDSGAGIPSVSPVDAMTLPPTARQQYLINIDFAHTEHPDWSEAQVKQWAYNDAVAQGRAAGDIPPAVTPTMNSPFLPTGEINPDFIPPTTISEEDYNAALNFYTKMLSETGDLQAVFSDIESRPMLPDWAKGKIKHEIQVLWDNMHAGIELGF